jgi:hypothetical protein
MPVCLQKRLEARVECQNCSQTICSRIFFAYRLLIARVCCCLGVLAGGGLIKPASRTVPCTCALDLLGGASSTACRLTSSQTAIALQDRLSVCIRICSSNVRTPIRPTFAFGRAERHVTAGCVMRLHRLQTCREHPSADKVRIDRTQGDLICVRGALQTALEPSVVVFG